MEISVVRQRLLQAIERARKASALRRAQNDEAGRDYEAFLERIAVPLFRQVSNVLRALGHPFNVFTPGGSVRLMSDRSSDDYIELTLDTAGEAPSVMGRVRRTRGSRTVDSEGPLNVTGAIRDLTEEEVLAFVLKELEPFLEKQG
jgi:hypothetical protein